MLFKTTRAFSPFIYAVIVGEIPKTDGEMCEINTVEPHSINRLGDCAVLFTFVFCRPKK